MTLLSPAEQAAQFRVLTSRQGRHSLWPAYKPTPAGWQEALPSLSREDCLVYVRRHSAGLQVTPPRPAHKTVGFGMFFFGGGRQGTAAQQVE